MRSALGKGLNALISEDTVVAVTTATAAASLTGINLLPIERVRANPKQPRRHFNEKALTELSASIKEKGVLQPILVVSIEGGNYEIIAGERRWRAAQMAGLTSIPAVIRQGSERERFELALIENVQRQDLNPLEQAEGYRRLQDEFGQTQEQIAQAVGKDRAVIANTLRLLNLPDYIKHALSEEKISMGHARALLSVEDSAAQKNLFERILNEQLPVRSVENAAKSQKNKSTEPGETKAPPISIEAKVLQEQLQHHLGRKVEFQLHTPQAHKGWLRMEFYSLDDLEILITQLKNISK